MKFLLPGIFLIVLGFGNIIVGISKVRQYDSVVSELAELEPTSQIVKPSTLRRIQLADKSLDRLSHRLEQARAKRDLYRLPVFGGRIICGFGVMLIILAGLLALFQTKSPLAKSGELLV